MKKEKIYLFCFFLSFRILAFGQISGLIVNALDNQPLPFATIFVFNSSDSLANGAITNEKGFYSINKLPVGKYLIKSTSLGFKTKQFNLTINTNEKLTLDTIKLIINETQLSEIKIGLKSSVILTPSKSIHLIGKDKTQASSTAFELLGLLPTIKLDQVNYCFEVEGQKNVLLLIDGRPQKDHKILLSISPSSILKIEIINSPSLKYSEEGYTSIVNVILKEEWKQGINGSMLLQLPEKLQTNESNFNLSVGNKKINAFGSYDLYERNYLFRESYERLNLKTGSSYQNELNCLNRLELGHNLKFGINFSYKNKNNFNLTSEYTTYDRNRKYDIKNQYIDQGNTSPQIFNIHKTENGQIKINIYSMFYQRSFIDQNKELSVAIDYYKFNSENEQNLLPVNNLNEIVNDHKDRWYLNSEINLQLPFFEKNNFIEIGGKFNRQFINTYTVSALNIDSLSYIENLYTFYSEYRYQTEKIMFKIGLRTEGSEKLIYFDKINPEFVWLPSLNMTYLLTNFKISFIYNTKIKRPTIWNLSPQLNKLDEMTYSMGNPFLKPTTTHNFEFKYVFSGRLFSNTVKLNYQYSKNMFMTLWKYNSLNNTAISQVVNSTMYKESGGYTNFHIQLLDKIEVDLDGSLSYLTFQTYSAGDLRYRNGFQYNTNISANWKMTKFINWSFSYTYMSSQIEEFGYSLNSPTFFTRISKSILNRKGNVSLKILNYITPNKKSTEYNNGIFNISTKNNSTIKFFMLDFSYRFELGKEFRLLKRRSIIQKDV